MHQNSQDIKFLMIVQNNPGWLDAKESITLSQDNLQITNKRLILLILFNLKPKIHCNKIYSLTWAPIMISNASKVHLRFVFCLLNNILPMTRCTQSRTNDQMYTVTYQWPDVHSHVPMTRCTQSRTNDQMYTVTYQWPDVHSHVPMTRCTQSRTNDQIQDDIQRKCHEMVCKHSNTNASWTSNHPMMRFGCTQSPTNDQPDDYKITEIKDALHFRMTDFSIFSRCRPSSVFMFSQDHVNSIVCSALIRLSRWCCSWFPEFFKFDNSSSDVVLSLAELTTLMKLSHDTDIRVSITTMVSERSKFWGD